MERKVQICHLVSFHILTSLLVICCSSINIHAEIILGYHSYPSRGVTVLAGTYPNPHTFYNQFVAKSESLLLKGVLKDSGHKAYKLWTDKYLRKKFGEEFVYVEKGKKEDRQRDISAISFAKFLDIYHDIDMYMVYSVPPAMQGKRDISAISFAKFLDIYHDIDVYMVYSVPPAMQEDVEVPFTLQCGGFQNNLHDAVIWFSGGGTKSVLHYDSADNILCSLDGIKQVVLIDKKYADIVMSHDFMEEGAYSLLDVDNVDEEKFADVLSLPWVQVNITKGDCLYIPYKWFHQVYSPPGRNLAINMWFSHLLWFNTTDCAGVARGTPFKSLSEFDLVSPNEQLRTEVLEAFADMEFVKKEEFIQELRCEDMQDREKIWNFINKNGDEELTWPEMYRFSMDDLVADFPQCFLRPAQMEDADLDEDSYEGDVVMEQGHMAHSTDTPAGKSGDASTDNEVDKQTEGINNAGDKIDKSVDNTVDKKTEEEYGEMDEQELEEINSILQKVYKDTKKMENEDFLDNIELGDYDAEELDSVNDKESEESLKESATVKEPSTDKKSEKVVKKDVHDEF